MRPYVYHVGISLFLLVVLHAGPISVYGQTQDTLSASKDNTLYESATGTLSNALGTHFFAGRTNQGTGSIRRGLIAFPIAASIPAGSAINSVTLTLSMSQTVTGDQTIQLRKVLADWGEATSEAAGGEGSGASATTGDATWLHRFFNTTLWSSPGGDFSGTVSASRSVGGTGIYTWGSTSAMVTDVQGWLDNPATNFGWALIGNEAAGQTAKRFDTREHPTEILRPRLIVSYTPLVHVDENLSLPQRPALHQNYPNPFNPSTALRYDVAAEAHVVLKIYDALGREVRNLVDELQTPGRKSVLWDGTDESGAQVSSGVYIFRMTAVGWSQSRKMLLVK